MLKVDKTMRRKAKQKNSKFFRLIIAVSMLGVLLSVGQGIAAVPRGRGEIWHGHGEIRDFPRHDFGVWRGGRWIHGWHLHRFGWWWTVGDLWYFYPAPVYPYPDPYTPPVVVVPPPPPPSQPQPQVWYYCQNPAGFYPYVPECSGEWQAVPATPPPPPPP